MQTETTQRVSVRLSGYGGGCVAYVQHFTEKYKPALSLHQLLTNSPNKLDCEVKNSNAS